MMQVFDCMIFVLPSIISPCEIDNPLSTWGLGVKFSTQTTCIPGIINPRWPGEDWIRCWPFILLVISPVGVKDELPAEPEWDPEVVPTPDELNDKTSILWGSAMNYTISIIIVIYHLYLWILWFIESRKFIFLFLFHLFNIIIVFLFFIIIYICLL